jgi:hypothetical protein
MGIPKKEIIDGLHKDIDGMFAGLDFQKRKI